MDFAEILPKLKGEDLYLYLTRSNPDWTGPDNSLNLAIHYGGNKVLLPLDDLRQVSYLSSSLYHFIDPKSILISWGIKDIFTYLKGRTGINLEMYGRIYDLGLICPYLGLRTERPATFGEAAGMLKKALADPRWPAFKPFYEKVYLPLSREVLPSVETTCLVDNRKRACVYPSYVLEGQANGRLKTVRTGSASYNPHSIGDAEKSNLRPADYDEVFVCLDYRNMEVNVLQWLSGDERLAGMLESDEDVYKAIWKVISGGEASEAQRALCKNFFLPVVFGQGKISLAKKIGVTEEIASRIIHTLNKTFPVAFDWVKSQSADGDNMATDFFGRRRKFADHEMYKIQNFCIQSPSSMICLRKLARLHEAVEGVARICFHVHDGYYLLCRKNDTERVVTLGTGVLEEPDDMFPGLRLRTSCHHGAGLDNLT
jgi:hypothetical protein